METEEIQTIDPQNYIGQEVKVMSAVYDEGTYGPMLKVTSTVIPLAKGDSLPEGKTLTASKIFSLSKSQKEEGKVVIAQDGALHEFLKKKKVDISKMPEFEKGLEVKALHGVDCKVQESKKGYLEIV